MSENSNYEPNQSTVKERGMRRKNNHKMNNNNNSGNNNGRRRYRNNSDNNSGKIKNVSASRDKFLNMARDAMASGDRVEAENYLQHAEHYYRVLSVLQEEDSRSRPPRDDNNPNQNSDNAANNASSNEDNSDKDNRGNKAAESNADDALKMAS